MIRIIKPGQKPKKYRTIYIITCPECGCEFECEENDIIHEKTIGGKKSVPCPCCGREYFLISGDFGNEDNYKTRKEEVVEIIPSFPKPNPLLGGQYPDPNIIDPCETCPNRFGPRDALGNPTVGDSPCQWCSHYKWRVICTNTSTGDKPDEMK